MAGGVTGGRPVAPWKEAEVLVGVHQPPEYDVSCSFRQFLCLCYIEGLTATSVSVSTNSGAT